MHSAASKDCDLGEYCPLMVNRGLPYSGQALGLGHEYDVSSHAIASGETARDNIASERKLGMDQQVVSRVGEGPTPMTILWASHRAHILLWSGCVRKVVIGRQCMRQRRRPRWKHESVRSYCRLHAIAYTAVLTELMKTWRERFIPRTATA